MPRHCACVEDAWLRCPHQEESLLHFHPQTFCVCQKWPVVHGSMKKQRWRGVENHSAMRVFETVCTELRAIEFCTFCGGASVHDKNQQRIGKVYQVHAQTHTQTQLVRSNGSIACLVCDNSSTYSSQNSVSGAHHERRERETPTLCTFQGRFNSTYISSEFCGLFLALLLLPNRRHFPLFLYSPLSPQEHLVDRWLSFHGRNNRLPFARHCS